ncbi:MAG: rod shape-determining protein MreD [Bacteroidetes bacterium]|nr:MAG: rod shape-determining protein MreD [Bacteroidota bacterium]
MINLVSINIVRFGILILLQVLVLNNIELFQFVNPYLYVLFILLLPVQIPHWLIMVTSFFMGLCIDILMNTIGMHIAASVLVAYIRPYILGVLIDRGKQDAEISLNFRQLGFERFLLYAVIMVFIHHTVLFYIEVFRMTEFFSTLGRVFLNSFFTLLLIVMSQFIFVKNTKD